jgi:hypothetical protein
MRHNKKQKQKTTPRNSSLKVSSLSGQAGIDTVEIHFNESEFLAILRKNGLVLLNTYTLSAEDLSTDRARGNAIRTCVCRKLTQ